MAIRPRLWQQQLIQLLRRRLESDSSTAQDLLVFAGPGAGKTFGALLAFQSMQGEGRLQRFLVFCHRTSILEQWQRAAERLGLQLKPWPCNAEEAASADGLLLTYQSAGRQPHLLSSTLRTWPAKGVLAIADEAHHLGVDPDNPSAAVWGQTFLDLTQHITLRLGLTGTPFRADNLGFCAARRIRAIQNGEVVEQIQPDLCVEPRELIAAGDVRPLEFRFQDGWVEHSQEGQPDREVSPLSQEQRESWRARNLRRAIRLADSSCIGQQVLLQAQRKLTRIRRNHPDAAGLVIARDIDHATAITAVLREDGHQVDLVHSQDPDAAGRLSRFQAGDADWLVSIDMCAEGFDAPRLRVVAYLTTVVTRSRFLQGITRAVRMTPELAEQEAIPREASYVYAPADPLLMEYARSWSVAEPYILRSRDPDDDVVASGAGAGRGPSLPLEAVEDGAAEVIRLKTPQLPSFLQR
ncbi:MAG: DEAD/DEAH box helicase family protein [Synechococcus sp.]|nr:DEAD/DEAH box helicase family protein [Synechococcus sp.]